MRIRTIKPEFFRSESIANLEPLARILFQGLWCLADRDGRLWDRPRRIKVEVLPYDDFDIEAGLREMERSELIVRYNTADGKAIQIVNFSKHQRINGKELEKDSEIPDVSAQVPDIQEQETGEATGKHSGSTCEAPGITGREGKGMERKGMDVSPEHSAKPKDSAPTSRKALSDELFLSELNRHYPDIDVAAELRKMDAWLMTRPGKQKTRRFVVNWLNRVDPGMKINGSRRTEADRDRENTGLDEGIKLKRL